MQNLIKQYAVFLGGLLALALLAGACYITYSITDSHWSEKYSKLELNYSKASAAASEKARAKEQEYQANVDAIAAQGAKDLAAAQSDADSANAAIERLRQRINTVLANTSTEDSGTTKRGKTARDALVLLTDVLEKSLNRSRQLADFADKAHNAGLTCQRSWEAIKSNQ